MNVIIRGCGQGHVTKFVILHPVNYFCTRSW